MSIQDKALFECTTLAEWKVLFSQLGFESIANLFGCNPITIKRKKLELGL